MKNSKIPQLLKHPIDHSLTLWHSKPKYSLLWLHGLGDQAQTYLPFFTHLKSPLFHLCRIKLLQAPKRFITVNQQETNAWFDLKVTNRFSIPEDQVYDISQINQSYDLIAQYCQEQEQFWKGQEPRSSINPQHRIFVGGFSQGGVAALNYAISTDKAPAGVIAVSSHLLKKTPLNNLGRLPMLLLHGSKDGTIRQNQAKTSYSPLLEQDGMIRYESNSKLDHEMSLSTLLSIRKWLTQSYNFIEDHYTSPIVS